MLRDDFIRLFHTANRISYTPTTTDEPPSPPTATDRQPEPTPPQPPLSELKSQQGTAKGWWSWWSWWGKKQQPETNKMLLEREKQAAAAIAEAATMAASGSMPPGTLLNEAFLRRHGWFADLRVRCASDEPDVSASGGGGKEEDEEGEQEESEKGHGAFACHKFLLCVRSPYFQGTGLRACVRACRVVSCVALLTKQVLVGVQPSSRAACPTRSIRRSSSTSSSEAPSLRCFGTGIARHSHQDPTTRHTRHTAHLF
jgi:hypothetical protein